MTIANKAPRYTCLVERPFLRSCLSCFQSSFSDSVLLSQAFESLVENPSIQIDFRVGKGLKIIIIIPFMICLAVVVGAPACSLAGEL